MATIGPIQRITLLVVLGLLTGILGHAAINEAPHSASGNNCAKVCPDAQLCKLTTNGVRFLFRCVGLDGQEQMIRYIEPDMTLDIETVLQTLLLPGKQMDVKRAQDVMRELIQSQEHIHHTKILQPSVLGQQDKVPQQVVLLPQHNRQSSVISQETVQAQEIVQPSIILKHIERQDESPYPPKIPTAQPGVVGTPELRPYNASRIRHLISKALEQLGRSPSRLNVNPSKTPMFVNPRETSRLPQGSSSGDVSTVGSKYRNPNF